MPIKPAASARDCLSCEQTAATMYFHKKLIATGKLNTDEDDYGICKENNMCTILKKNDKSFCEKQNICGKKEI